jgi:SAM-dependent methyltransferase
MRMPVEKEYLDYYGEHDIIPVRQDTADLPLHMARRRCLYRHLGLQPGAFRNSRVVEFGPGTGDNALYVASCSPSSYVLVDGNPASVRAIEDKLERGLLPRDRVQCRPCEILGFTSPTPFDVVLCEGVLGGQADPEAFLGHVASFVAPEGALVITTMSPASLLAETCRRVLKPVFSARARGRGHLLEELVAFFGPDLRSLPGMSRLHEDWVLDSILRPWPERYAFTVPEAIAALEAGFDMLAASPSFVQDWRWYKSIPQHPQTWNDVALEQYDLWSGYLLDYRIQPTACCPAQMSEIDSACQAALEIQHRIWHDDAIDLIPDFVASLLVIREMIASTMPETARSIADFVGGLDQLLNGNVEADFGSFRTWFGRGQQYVSFLRRPAAV